ncbi:MAG: hypothetical protein IKA61_03855 [Clostridia bacterium]|nr:hypothetical protein [Clostridia bacterium]
MKRTILIGLVFLLAFSIVSCTKNVSDSKPTSESVVESINESQAVKFTSVDKSAWEQALVFNEYRLLRTLVHPNGSVSTILLIKKGDFIYYCYGEGEDSMENYYAKIGGKYYQWSRHDDFSRDPGWDIKEIEEENYDIYVNFPEFINFKYEDFAWKASERAYYAQSLSYIMPGSEIVISLEDVFVYFENEKVSKVRMIEKNKYNVTYEFSYADIILDLPFSLEDYSQLDL